MANCKCKEFLDSFTFECDWKDLGLMGLCVGSLGALVGMIVPEKYKNAAAFGTGAGFFLSAIALTVKSIEAARYDEFDPNREIANNNKREYSVGLNYFVKGQGLKFILNYVFCQNDAAKDSHRIMLGTQLLI